MTVPRARRKRATPIAVGERADMRADYFGPMRPTTFSA